MAKGVVNGGLNSGGSNVKSIQRITQNMVNLTTIDITIGAVKPENTIVRISYFNLGNDTSGKAFFAVELLNSTTVRLNRGTTNGANSIVVIEVIEFNNVKSKQSGTVTTSSGSTSIVISSVDVSKSLLFHSHTSPFQDTTITNSGVRGEVVDSTHVGLFIGNTGSNFTIKWQLIEFN